MNTYIETLSINISIHKQKTFTIETKFQTLKEGENGLNKRRKITTVCRVRNKDRDCDKGRSSDEDKNEEKDRSRNKDKDNDDDKDKHEDKHKD